MKIKDTDLVWGDVPTKVKYQHKYKIETTNLFAKCAKKHPLYNKKSLTYEDIIQFPVIIQNLPLLKRLLPDFYHKLKANNNVYDGNNVIETYTLLLNTNTLYLTYGTNTLYLAYGKDKKATKTIPILNTDFDVNIYSMNKESKYLLDYINLVIKLHKQKA